MTTLNHSPNGTREVNRIPNLTGVGFPHHPLIPATPTIAACIPRKDTVTSLLCIGPIPVSKIVATHAMVDEANREPKARGTELSYSETAIRSKIERSAQKTLDKAVSGPVEAAISGIKPLHAKINVISHQLDTLDDLPILGANGETLPVHEAADIHDTVRDRITQESNAGSKKHLLRARGGKWKEIGALVLDFPVFLLAMFGLLNVNLRLIGPDLKTSIMAATAAVFAILGTVLFATTMRTMGRRHRAFKGHDTTMEVTGHIRRRIMLEVAAIIAIVAGAASVMAARIILDGAEADAPMALVIALALLFAALIGVSGYINYMAEYENGSDDTDTVQHLGGQLQNRQKIRNDWQATRKLTVEEAGLRVAKLNRLIAEAQGTAEHTVTGSTNDKAIRLARSYHGYTGNHGQLPKPTLDLTRLELAQVQARELKDQQAYLETTYTGKDA